MENIIECKGLSHQYGNRLIYENLDFQVKKGQILGLLGKNGTGKTTTINILNGYLKPLKGECLIFGEDSQTLSPMVKSKIGFLLEGHIQYGFMNIVQIEKFFAQFYSNWKREAYWELMNKLKVSQKQKINSMSCGQRSQVALGLILAQDPELMILDDFSMGLDPGYRRLFIEYLRDWAKSGSKTIFTTSHIIQDMEYLIDDCMIMDYGGLLISTSVDDFLNTFKCYSFKCGNKDVFIEKNEVVKNYDVFHDRLSIYSFASKSRVIEEVKKYELEITDLDEKRLNLEDAFIGLTGKY
ncbi:MAG: ABC transporter ATP-binding protein [Bacteroidales bacterium]